MSTTTTTNQAIKILRAATASERLYLVIGTHADADSALRVIADKTTGVICVPSTPTPRPTVDALAKMLDISQYSRVDVIVPPEKHAVGVSNEIIRRYDRDKIWVTRESTWGSDTALASLTPRVVASIVGGARRLPIPGLLDPDDLIERALEAAQDPLRDVGVRTGWASLDNHYRPAPGYVTVVTGTPSHGKSTWLDALLVQLAQLHDWRFCIFSPESYPAERHILRLAARHANRPYKGVNAMPPAQCADALKWASQHFTIYDPDLGAGVDSILESATAVLRRQGINGLVIDPWCEVEQSRPQGMTETEYISLALGKIRRWARAHHVHVWVVAHPAKPEKQRKSKRRDDDEDGPQIPGPYDISGSAHWYNKADACITVFRDVQDLERVTQVHVLKVRVQPDQGCPGVIELTHVPGIERYIEYVRKPAARLYPAPVPAPKPLPKSALATEQAAATARVAAEERIESLYAPAEPVVRDESEYSEYGEYCEGEPEEAA